MSMTEVAISADFYAKQEIEQYKLPAHLHYDLSYRKAIEIAQEVKANIDLVRIGVALMDIKLGEAFQRGELGKHVEMSVDASVRFLSDKLSDNNLDIIINCIEGHHGKIPFKYVEAEICANADCYRFIHPTGVFFYISNLGKRSLPASEIFSQAKSKLTEKWDIVSIDYVRNELEDYYIHLLQYFDDALNGIKE